MTTSKKRRGGVSAVPEAASELTREDALRIVYEMTGAVRAFEFSAASNALYRVLAIRAVKEHRTYEAAGYTWEAFCLEVLDRPRTSVDEDIRNLDRFGGDFMQLADELSLSRTTMRALYRLPDSEIPTMEGGMLQIGEERVSLDATDKVLEVLEDILADQHAMKARLDDGETQLNERDTELAALKKEIDQLKRPPTQMEMVSDFARCCVVIRDHMAMALRMVDQKAPGTEPETVLTWVRAWGGMHSQLVQYGGQYTPATDLDPEIFDLEAAEALHAEEG